MHYRNRFSVLGNPGAVDPGGMDVAGLKGRLTTKLTA